MMPSLPTYTDLKLPEHVCPEVISLTLFNIEHFYKRPTSYGTSQVSRMVSSFNNDLMAKL